MAYQYPADWEDPEIREWEDREARQFEGEGAEPFVGVGAGASQSTREGVHSWLPTCGQLLYA